MAISVNALNVMFLQGPAYFRYDMYFVLPFLTRGILLFLLMVLRFILQQFLCVKKMYKR